MGIENTLVKKEFVALHTAIRTAHRTVSAEGKQVRNVVLNVKKLYTLFSSAFRNVDIFIDTHQARTQKLSRGGVSVRYGMCNH